MVASVAVGALLRIDRGSRGMLAEGKTWINTGQGVVGPVEAHDWSSCSWIWPSFLAATLAKRPRRDGRAGPGSAGGAGAADGLTLNFDWSRPTRSPTTTLGANLSKWAWISSSMLHHNIHLPLTNCHYGTEYRVSTSVVRKLFIWLNKTLVETWRSLSSQLLGQDTKHNRVSSFFIHDTVRKSIGHWRDLSQNKVKVNSWSVNLYSALYIHGKSKKLCHYTFIHNFDKCWQIFKIPSLLYSPSNLQQNPCHTAHQTLDV